MQQVKWHKLFSNNGAIIFFSVLSFLLIVVFTGIHYYILFPPQGLHFSRQADSSAFSEYFFMKNSGLFSPGNLNLQSIDGKCASEFPLIYYLTAITYKVFGVNFLSLKIITLLLLYFAFLFCVKTIYLLSNSISLSFFLTLLFFSSTVILYYGSLYLPDIHAFSLCVVSFYYFFLYFKEQNQRHLYFLFFFITLAVLFKVSFYYYECIFLIMIYLISKKYNLKFRRNFILFIISSTIVAVWFIYVRKYNETNFAYYYTTSPRPFWKYSFEMIQKSFVYISDYWYPKYYFQSTFHFFLMVFLVYVLFIKKVKLDLWLIFLLIIFSCIYCCLFLTQFIDHDYYFIAIVPCLIVCISISFISIRNKLNNKIWLKNLLSLVILVLAFLSFNYAKLNLHRRYTNNIDSYSIVRYQLNDIGAYLDSLHIKSDSKFVVIGDRSQNGSLVMLNKFGWIYPDFNFDRNNLNLNLAKADYLIVLKPSKNKIPEDLMTRLANCNKLVYNSNFIYPLMGCLK